MNKPLCCISVLGLAVLSGPLHAAVLTRTDGAGTWDFNTTKFTSTTGVNWTNNADTARFDKSGSGFAMSVNNAAGQVGAAGMTFGNASGNWIFQGQPLQLGSGGIAHTLSNGSLNISNDVQMTAGQTWTLNANKAFNLIGALTGAGDFVFDGLLAGGTLKFAGANAFAGSTKIQNRGTLQLDYSVQSNSKLDSGRGVVLTNTAVLQWLGGSAYTQAISGLTIAGSGDAYLQRVSGNGVLQAGAITRAASDNILRLSSGNILTASNLNTNGILGAWATTGAGWAYQTGDAYGTIGESLGTADLNPGTGWTVNENVNWSGALISPLTDKTIHTLRLGWNTTAAVHDLSGSTLTLAGGGLQGANSSPVLTNGYVQSGLPSGELFIHALNGQNLTIPAVIQNNGSTPTRVIKGGPTTLTLNGANTFTGGSVVRSGTLVVGGNGVLPGSTRVSLGSTLTINAGGVADSVTAELSTGNGVANVNNSGTVSGTLTILPPLSGPTYVFGGNAIAGYAKLNAGSATGPVVANGRLDVLGAATVGAISGSGTNGVIANSSAANNTLTFQGGSSFAQFWFGADGAKATLEQTGAGSVYFNYWGYNSSTPRSSHTFNGGSWILGNIGQNNTGTQTTGTNTVAGGASVTVAGGTGFTHGTWNLANGSLLFNGGIAENNGNVNAALVLNVSGAGALTAGGLTLAGGGAANMTNALNIGPGGVVSMTGNVTLGNTTAQTAELDTLNLDGGLLSVNGTLSASAATVGQARLFNWTGGQLTAAIITTNAGFATPASGGLSATALVQSGGLLAPGDLGVAGRTTVNGGYMSGPSSLLSVDIGGTTQASGFQTGQYDYLYVNNGAAALGGNLRVNLINGFTPTAANTFDVLASTGGGSALSGSFANVAGGQLYAADGYSRFAVAIDSVNKRVRLSNYALNQWSAAGDGTWEGAGAWSLAEPSGSDYAAFFGPALASSGTVALNAGRTVRALVFTNGAASYAVAGSGSLTLQGDALTAPLVRVTAGSHAVSVPVELAQAAAVDVASGCGLTLAGAISGGQALTKTGAGSLTLSGDNALGAVAVSGGTVVMSAGTSAFDALSLADGAAFSLVAGSLTLQSGLALTGSGTLNVQRVGGSLLIKRGSDGGALDTVSDVTAAIAAGRVTARGRSVAASAFNVTEVNVSGTWYVSVTLKSYGTMIMAR
jgi:autotransporter-associated beta strand protein